MNQSDPSDADTQSERHLRKRVSVIVIQNGRVLGFRAQDPANQKRYIFLPGGKIEAGETIEQAAIRETQEETGYQIKIESGFTKLERYNFAWNGACHDCQTWYLQGVLAPLSQAPPPVIDADYNQGVQWTDIDDVPNIFGYHAAILRPIQLVTGRLLERAGELAYFSNRRITTDQVVHLYRDAGLKRPVDDLQRMQAMYENSNLVVSAWIGDELVGVARSLTDFSYCCYLSDLAVQKRRQRLGVGQRLIALTKALVGPQSMLLLLSSADAMDYYPQKGFSRADNAFLIRRER